MAATSTTTAKKKAPSVTMSGATERVSAHTHIRGLGLNEFGEVPSAEEEDSSSSCGLIGQVPAREAAGPAQDVADGLLQGA